MPGSLWTAAFVSGWLCCALWAGIARGQQIETPAPPSDEPIAVQSARASRWTEGQREVWLFSERVTITQGRHRSSARAGVLWIERAGQHGHSRNRVIAYLEGDVTVESPTNKVVDRTWLGEFSSDNRLDLRVRNSREQRAKESPLYQAAIRHRDPRPANTLVRTQFEVESVPEAAPETVPGPAAAGPQRRIRFFKRGDLPFEVESFPTAGGEQVFVFTQGVNVVIEGVDLGIQGGGSVDILTDSLVVWTTGGLNMQEANDTEDRPVQIYMEGDIVFRQGQRVIYAERMFYDVNRQSGTVIDAEMLTPAPGYAGTLRLRSKLVRQHSRDLFEAQSAWITSSRIGDPRYRLQANNVWIEDREYPVFEAFSGMPAVDAMGNEIVEHQRYGTARGNVLYLGPVPVFYWPVLGSDLEDPDFYIRRLQIMNDNIFGNGVLTEWDGYELFGIRRPPEGTDLNLNLDYMSFRGPGAGASFDYNRADLYNIPGPYNGMLDAWFIKDHGDDNLGFGRRRLTPDTDLRGRIFGRHRHHLPNDFQLTAELGWISDRNFLEQYYENEWDEFKDQDTSIELKQLLGNMSWDVYGRIRVNDFFTETNWLPRFDHFWLGQSLLSDYVTWYEHSEIGYGAMRTASTPSDPQDLARFTLFPWEANVEGVRAATTHEFDVPLQLGPVKVVPYALGQFAYWGENLAGNDVDRFYYQTGVRASLPFWTIYPDVEDSLLNVHGLAHKVVFDVDAYYAESNENVTNLALYDEIDDNSIEHFRRGFTFNTFGGTVPPQFDPRFYGIRSGLASNVTSPSLELADDLEALRLGMRHRWQTKRGLPGNRHIVDWITLQTEAVYFPEANRDNFGEDVGLVGYDFAWHVGDRFTLTSDGGIDFFSQGQRLFSVGGILQRPTRGRVHTRFDWLEGPIDARVLTTSFSYQLSPKWIGALGTSIDFGPSGNIGQRISLTRIGESFLLSVGFTANTNKDTVGIRLGIQPRFIPAARFGDVGAGGVPPPGSYGID